MRLVIPALLTLAATGAAADPVALNVLDAERQLAAHAQHAALRSAEPDTAERLDAQRKLLELHVADQKLSPTQRQKAEGVLRLLQAVRDEPRTLDGQPELPQLTVAVGQAGRSCAQAIPLDQGDARRLPIAAGESLWFRVQLPDAVNLGLSTRGSSVDAALTVHADCRTVDQPAVAHADDNYGLQADLVVPTARQAFWLVRYENLSPVGGYAVLRATTSGILQGTVRTQEGELVPGPQPRINLFRRESNFWSFQGSASADEGSFSFPVVQAGVYGARTERQGLSPYLDQAFDQIDCIGSSFPLNACNNGNVTHIPLSSGETREISFRLKRGILLTGTVKNLQEQPIANANVQLSLDFGSFLNTTTDAAGRYRFEGNPPGNARLRASALRHQSVMFDNLACGNSCNFPSGATPLPLSFGSAPTADFVLPFAPGLSVNLSLINDTVTNLSSTATLSLLRPNGSLVAERFVLISSGPTVIDGITPGEYLLRIQSPSLIPRLYPDIECADDCIAELDQAQRIIINNSADDVELDFQVRRYPMIFGALRDAQTGLAVNTQSSSSSIELLRVGGTSVQNFSVNAQGEYFLRGVAPGSYVLRARNSNYRPSVHSGFQCSLPLFQCTEFTPITLTRDSPDQRVDFSLSPLGRLIVSTNSSIQESLALAVLSPSAQVEAEFFLSSALPTPQVVNGIPLGTHIFGLRSFSVVPQLFQNVDCPNAAPSSFSGCPFALATPLLIQSGQSQSVSFNLRPINARRVVVRAADTAAPLAGVALDLWDGSGFRVGGFITGSDGGTWIRSSQSINPANFALSTDNRQGYLDQVHAGINCPNGSAFLGLCSLSGATPISLPAPGNQPTIEILLQRETPLFRNGFEPGS